MAKADNDMSLHDPNYGDDDERDTWCSDFAGHTNLHEFCEHHQAAWCRTCDRACPECVEDPHCPDCGVALFQEEHDWDCSYYGE